MKLTLQPPYARAFARTDPYAPRTSSDRRQCVPSRILTGCTISCSSSIKTRVAKPEAGQGSIACRRALITGSTTA